MKLGYGIIVVATTAFFLSGASGYDSYTYVGCVFDSRQTRVLTADSVKGNDAMTTEVRISSRRGGGGGRFATT